MANYLLMITWIPAGIVFMEKIKVFMGKFRSFKPQFIGKIHGFLNSITTQVFHEILPCLVKKLWLLWLILFLSLGISGIVVTFVKPKLDLPKSEDFALFDEDNVLEVWFQHLKYEFRYYRLYKEQRSGGGLRLVAAWGLEGKDTGNY